MNTIKRTKKIIAKNWNDLTTSLTKPDDEIRLAIGKMEQSLLQLRRLTAVQMAEAKTTERQITQLIYKRGQWQESAELALNHNNDELAKKALHEKVTINHQIEQKEVELGKINRDVADLKKAIVDAEQALPGYQNKVRLIQHNEIFAKTGISRIQSQVDNIESLEQRFEQLEASVKVREMKSKPSLDEELARLKENINKQ